MTERDCENYKHHISRDCENCCESAEPTSADEQIQSIVEKRVAELVHLNYELEQQLADRPRGEWIPCDERLPNIGGVYLTTTAKGSVCIDHFYSHDDGERHWSYCRKRTPIAWMPLPMPYREDGEA